MAEIVVGRFEESRYHCSNTERGEGSGAVSCEGVQRHLAEIVDGRFEESRYHCSNTERGKEAGQFLVRVSRDVWLRL